MKRVFIFLYFSLIVVFSLCLAPERQSVLAQSSWTGKILKETIEGGSTTLCYPIEKARELCPKKLSGRKMKKLSGKHNAKIVEIKENKMKCRMSEKKQGFYRCRMVYTVALQRRRDFTYEEKKKMHIAKQLIAHTMPGLNIAEQMLSKHKGVYGAILSGTAIADYGKRYRQSMNSIKRLKRQIEKLKDPSEEIVFDKMDKYTAELRQTFSEVNGLYRRLPPKQVKKLGYPSTGKEMFDKGKEYLKSGKMDLSLYWFEHAAAKGYPGAKKRVNEIKKKLKK